MRLHIFSSADGMHDDTGITSNGLCMICGHEESHPLHEVAPPQSDLRLFVVTKAVLEKCFEAGIEWRDLAKEYESSAAFERWFAENIYDGKAEAQKEYDESPEIRETLAQAAESPTVKRSYKKER